MSQQDPRFGADHLPESPVEGLVPTLNNTGWMTISLDRISRDFAHFAGTIDDEALDIGCAYGIATLAALADGARVCACDMESAHLDVLMKRVEPDARARLRCVTGTLPAVDFPIESFGAVLAARVLHFLSGEDIESTIHKIHDWLRPGGRIFLVADTPYVGPWKFLSGEYERRKAAGEPWPGLVADYAQFLSAGTDPSAHPSFINPLDPDILARVCIDAGFEILDASFLRGGTPHASDRDHAGVIARKH
jgi:SAM-dependent methyltransferase